MKLKLILSGLLFLSIVSCRKKSTDDYSYYDTKQSDSIAAIDTTPVESPVVEAVVEAEAVTEEKGVDLNDNYFLVVASYTVEDFALEQKQKLAEKGFHPEVFMINDDGWFKLAVKSYKTEKEATNGLAELKANEDMFSQAYIVFKKSK